jgi:vacuolar protein sorting-associated protein VTA1
MATQLPAKLKSLDIQRFALRASQLETAKPSIAYWCPPPLSNVLHMRLLLRIGEYWIVNQILAKGLHTSDAECLQYTTALMDKLEQVLSWIYSFDRNFEAHLTFSV